MPLPSEGSIWPPASPARLELSRLADLYASRSLGYRGDPILDPDLASQGSGRTRDRRRVRASVAADVASVAASLLVGAGVDGRVSPSEQVSEEQATATNARLKEYFDGGLNARLLEAAELASVFGGAFIRVVADPTVRRMPYATVVDPTRVQPTFVDGVLVAATIWTELLSDAKSVWRFVEHRDNRSRTIESGLFVGTWENLGDQVSMDSLPETAGIEPVVEYPAELGSSVFYVPNMLPNRRIPQSPLGRSDLQGSESLCAAIDVVATSLVRDVRLGRARMIVPSDALQHIADGSGAEFDQAQDLFTTLDVAPASEAGKVTSFQGQIRATDHQTVIKTLMSRLVGNAGYSDSTFDLVDNLGSASSGTALKIREARTLATVTAKRRYFTPVLQDVLLALLQLDRAVFGSPVAQVAPVIKWPPVRDDDPLERAQVIDTLMRANALSVEAAVRQAHPDLDEAAVQKMVQEIVAEKGIAPIDAGPSPDVFVPAPGF